MSGLKSRRKGATFERALVQMFRDAMPGEDVKRGLQCRAGSEAPDVDCPVFWVEAKAHARTNIKAALRQAEEASGESKKIPLAVCKDDRQKPIAAMYLDDFLDFLKNWWELTNR